MASQHKRPQMSRARQRAMFQRRLLWIGIAAAVVICAAVAAVLIVNRLADESEDMPAAMPLQAVVNGSGTIIVDPMSLEDADGAETVAEAPTPEPTPEPTPVPEAEPAPVVDADRAATRPQPTAEGFLPIFTKAETEEKIIAITVDDCFQAENLRNIVSTAKENNAKLTIFPIGENVLRTEQAAILKDAWENGFELENHTYSHNGLYKISDEKLAQEVYTQQLTLSHILGLEYHCHFLRPMGGDARRDQRMQMYAKQLGYYGIAHWSCAGSTSTDKEIAKALKPGAIYLFHTTDNDWQKLERFIPWVAQQGYQMVTLNEMFGYPANETSELTQPAKDYPVPPLEPYTRVYTPMSRTTYSWYAYLLQQKLIELGYLTGEPDGIYGEGCENAVRAYQRDHQLKETGVADVELQESLLGNGETT